VSLIRAIRISTGKDLRPAATPSELVTTDDLTLALFPFREGEGSIAHDVSQHAWRAKLVDTAWHFDDSTDR
jgi:hypothetical protein